MTEQELKQRFFVQYYGQNVYIDSSLSIISRGKTKRLSTGDLEGGWIDTSYLVLKDIDNIVKEHIKFTDFTREDFLSQIKKYRDLTYYEADMLRSIGYLVPFMHLSIQDILDRGWAKYE